MASENLIRYPSKQKALDHALWLTFKNRVEGLKYGAILSIEGDYLVVPQKHPTFKGEEFEILPQTYAFIPYQAIKQIRQDVAPFPHWEVLYGTFSTMDGELLRFLLEYQVNLQQFIRFELASRGFDKDHKWCGFQKAEEIWLE